LFTKSGSYLAVHRRVAHDRFAEEDVFVELEHDLMGAVLFGVRWFRQFVDEQTEGERLDYERAEDQARAARRGLWQEPNPEAP
jgi:hypothetical protein